MPQNTKKKQLGKKWKLLKTSPRRSAGCCWNTKWNFFVCRIELQKNPKQVTNKAAKGKYKFLQKYYHRFVIHDIFNLPFTIYLLQYTIYNTTIGLQSIPSNHDLSWNDSNRGAFYLDNEEDVLKRDTTGATLEDRFDKTVSSTFLPLHHYFFQNWVLLYPCISIFFHLISPPGSSEGYASEELWQVFKDKVHPFGWSGTLLPFQTPYDQSKISEKKKEYFKTTFFSGHNRIWRSLGPRISFQLKVHQPACRRDATSLCQTCG